MLTADALELLTRLEQREARLLCWGHVDGGFTVDELVDEARAVLRNGGRHDADPWTDVVTPLLDVAWLWEVPGTELYRTRMGESVRLAARLRQIRDWNGRITDNTWRSSPTLVADYRFVVRPRRFPERRHGVQELIDDHQLTLTPVQRAVLNAFVHQDDAPPRRLAAFQVRATRQILRATYFRRSGGTIVCAGTASGKTLSFYMPALTAIAQRIDETAWTKCLAIYPRNELLKDQLREAVGSILRIAPSLGAANRRSISIGALYSDVPRDAEAAARPPYGWRAATARAADISRPGRACPLLRCPRCDGTLVWLDDDLRVERERLHCSSPGCGLIVDGMLRLTRKSMFANPPDILFTSAEMLNQRLGSQRHERLFGIGQPDATKPFLVLLDEVHSYEGTQGAHVALLLRRWRARSQARPHFVGLSATLEDAERFFGDVVGLPAGAIERIEPTAGELVADGAEYLLALRGDPSSGAGLLSTTIQTTMLARRILAANASDPQSGTRVFAFVDNLDIVNRFFLDLLDAEARADTGALLPGRQPLAAWRASARPQADARMQEGQNWELPERIGHALRRSLSISRTSSQDRGVDGDADVVVATSALEVGFDDPCVGAVVQHKAPQAAAGFLQRKGRAGRSQTMRPWTIVVLSDFGRDRLAYQSYETLFSPVLEPAFLPLSNRSVLRMQATYALFEWLALQVQGNVEPWTDLARPATTEYGRDLQSRYVTVLRSLLTDAATRTRFETYLQQALLIDLEEARALLWEPPRAVLLEAVPTLLRRLETNWVSFAGTAEPHLPHGPPVPEFVQRTLFGELLTPEVRLLTSSRTGELSELESMGIAQSLREFSPGRVSRRFAVEGRAAHWIDPGVEPTLTIGTLSGAEEHDFVEDVAYCDGSTLKTARLYRPTALRVSIPPADIDATSNAHPEWRAELREGRGVPHLIELPNSPRWNGLFASIRFHTHHLGCPVEFRRFTVGSRCTISRRGTQQQERVVTFVDAAGNASALGFRADVDAIEVNLAPVADIAMRCRNDLALIRSLRVMRFRDALRGDPQLDGVINSFQRDQLVEALLSSLARHLVEAPGDTGAALEHLLTDRAVLEDTIRRLALWSDSADAPEVPADDGGTTPQTRRTPRRLRELLSALNDPRVDSALRTATEWLTVDFDARWNEWLQRALRATMAAAFRDAVVRLSPRIDPEAFSVELDARPTAVDAWSFWLVETQPGGAGAIEAFYESLASDPRRFLTMLDEALAAGEAEVVSESLDAAVHHAVDPSGPLSTVFDAVRGAQGHAASLAALARLRHALASIHIVPDQSFMISLHARVLRPGSHPATDEYLNASLARWDHLEEAAGVAFDVVAFAIASSNDEALENALAMPPPSADPDEIVAWRYSVLRGLLWQRGARQRRETLRLTSSFGPPVECDRLLACAVLQAPQPAIEVPADGWFERLTTALVNDGSADIMTNPGDDAALARALLTIATRPIETEGLRIYARVTAVWRGSTSSRARLELPEAFQ